MNLLPLYVWLACLPVVFLSMRAFGQLVKLERDRYPEQWIADGRPGPFFQRGRLLSSFSASSAAQRCNFSWTFSTPAWARDDADAQRLLLRMRVLLLVWIFVAMPLFILSGVVAMRYPAG